MTDNKKKVYDNELHTSTSPIAGFSLYQGLDGNKESPAEKIYGKIETTQAQSLRNKQMQGLIKGETAEDQEASRRNPKRYLVDPSSGVINIDEEEGDLSYKDAVLTSASIIATLRAQSGDGSGVIDIFKEAISAIKENRASNSQDTEKKKEFYVDDASGAIIRDPENGELTLSEARAIAQSRNRVSSPNEGITKEGLELLKRDMRDEVKQAIESLGKEDKTPPFIFDNEGKPTLNPNSKGMSLSEVLAYQFITKSQNPQGNLYKTADGNILTLDDALSLKRFDREEARKDKKVDSLQELITEARKQMPMIGEGIKEMLSQRNIAGQEVVTRQVTETEEKVAETEEQPGGDLSKSQSVEL